MLVPCSGQGNYITIGAINQAVSICDITLHVNPAIDLSGVLPASNDQSTADDPWMGAHYDMTDEEIAAAMVDILKAAKLPSWVSLQAIIDFLPFINEYGYVVRETTV